MRQAAISSREKLFSKVEMAWLVLLLALGQLPGAVGDLALAG